MIMNRRLSQFALRASAKRFLSSRTRSTVPIISNFAGISPAWRPFAPIADEILGSRFTDEFSDETCRRLARTVDEAPMDCKESLKDFQIQINLPGNLISMNINQLS